MKRNNWIYLMVCLLLVACQSNKNKPTELGLDDLNKESMEAPAFEISKETMNDLIQSIPSPLEIASVIKSSGFSFQEDFLNPAGNVDIYSTSFDKSFNIGVYGGDLGYINMYEKSYLALSYLNSIKKLADDIKVGHFFDFETIKRLASNSTKLDSLIYISTSNFNKMDSYLQSQHRSNLSALIVAGTWLEGLYIATQVALEANNMTLVERIGEQKIVLDQILLILSAYAQNDYFSETIDNFNLIKDEYEQVTISYDYQEPDMEVVNGIMVIVDNSSSTVNITTEQVEQIGRVVEEVRIKMIKSI